MSTIYLKSFIYTRTTPEFRIYINDVLLASKTLPVYMQDHESIQSFKLESHTWEFNVENPMYWDFIKAKKKYDLLFSLFKEYVLSGPHGLLEMLYDAMEHGESYINIFDYQACEYLINGNKAPHKSSFNTWLWFNWPPQTSSCHILNCDLFDRDFSWSTMESKVEAFVQAVLSLSRQFEQDSINNK